MFDMRRASRDEMSDDVRITEDVGKEKASAVELEVRDMVRPLSIVKLLALTCSAGGLQLIWSTIFSNGSAFLFSLGITKSQSSLIWAAAPICGTFIQPIVGALGDNYRSRYGRRRPFMVVGALGIIVFLVALAFVEDITPQPLRSSTKIIAIILIILLNLFIQPLQSGFRALIVDACPPEQQAAATAWASRFVGIGNILGYFAGSIPLPENVQHHETVRFRFLSTLSCSMLAFAVTITTLCVGEPSSETMLHSVQNGSDRTGLSAWRRIVFGFRHMPAKVRWVCKVQFFSWMAWFGFLFYSSSYVSELYLMEQKRIGKVTPVSTSHSIAIGSSANLFFALVAFVTSIFLPWIIDAIGLYRGHASSLAEKKAYGKREFRYMATIWAFSNLLYSSCTLLTFFVTSTSSGMILVATVGLSWGVTQWIPFALISTEIASQRNERHPYYSIEDDDILLEQVDELESGVILGIHNAAMSLPQIFAALISSVVFWFVKWIDNEDDAIGWVLRFSALASLMAAWMVYRGA